MSGEVTDDSTEIRRLVHRPSAADNFPLTSRSLLSHTSYTPSTLSPDSSSLPPLDNRSSNKSCCLATCWNLTVILVLVLPSTPSCCQLGVVTTGAICHWDNRVVWQRNSLMLWWCWCWQIDIFFVDRPHHFCWQGSSCIVNISHCWFSWRCVTEDIPCFDSSARGTTVAFICILFLFTQLFPFENRVFCLFHCYTSMLVLLHNH